MSQYCGSKELPHLLPPTTRRILLCYGLLPTNTIYMNFIRWTIYDELFIWNYVYELYTMDYIPVSISYVRRGALLQRQVTSYHTGSPYGLWPPSSGQTASSRKVHWRREGPLLKITDCSLNVHSTCTQCSLNMHVIFTEWSRKVPGICVRNLLTEWNVHGMFTENFTWCSRNVH
jgi:hypothetical protein